MNMENKDLERAIYKWFNMKYELYDKMEHKGSIYLYDDGDEYADIRIDKKHGYIHFKWNFWEDFHMIFPIRFDEFSQFMTKWVADTFNLEGFTPSISESSVTGWLKIPNYKQN